MWNGKEMQIEIKKDRTVIKGNEIKKNRGKCVNLKVFYDDRVEYIVRKVRHGEGVVSLSKTPKKVEFLGVVGESEKIIITRKVVKRYGWKLITFPQCYAEKNGRTVHFIIEKDGKKIESSGEVFYYGTSNILILNEDILEYLDIQVGDVIDMQLVKKNSLGTLCKVKDYSGNMFKIEIDRGFLKNNDISFGEMIEAEMVNTETGEKTEIYATVREAVPPYITVYVNNLKKIGAGSGSWVFLKIVGKGRIGRSSIVRRFRYSEEDLLKNIMEMVEELGLKDGERVTIKMKR